MASIFHQLSRPAIEGVREVIAYNRISFPCQPSSLASIVPAPLIIEVADELNSLYGQGMQASHIAYMLQLLVGERSQSQQKRDAIDLVWTGEEVLGTESRDTRVVVKELFEQAQASVLVSSFALDTGKKAKELFQPLVNRMERYSGLQVKLFVNVKRPFRDNHTSDATLLREFAETFRNNVWPSDRLPEVFYDPRSLSKAIAPRACLHAKCVVVDDEQLLVTSANFTEAAHQRNIEAGVLLTDKAAAKAMRSQFETLVERKVLCRLPEI